MLCDGNREHARWALGAWGLGEASLAAVQGGLINRTWVAALGSQRWILQWVNPIFDARVHHDIDAVTTHLEASGHATPRLIRTTEGSLYIQNTERGLWRLMTFVPGRTHQYADSPSLCESAGRLVGRFHRCLGTLNYRCRHKRAHVHDTPRHRSHLRDVLASGRDHRDFDAIVPVGREILSRGDALPPLQGVPARLVHGDLKISNIIFSSRGEAVALVDFDTLAEMSLPVEMGDAWRSWCNPAGEDSLEAALDLTLFDAAVRGYAAATRGWITEPEVVALPVAMETIALELSARFCADAIEEKYFGWDASRYASASHHNLARAQGQLALARSMADRRPRVVDLVSAAFAR